MAQNGLLTMHDLTSPSSECSVSSTTSTKMAKIRGSMSVIEHKSWPSFCRMLTRSERNGRKLEQTEANSAEQKAAWA
jgi:hypothetical protein